MISILSHLFFLPYFQGPVLMILLAILAITGAYSFRFDVDKVAFAGAEIVFSLDKRADAPFQISLMKSGWSVDSVIVDAEVFTDRDAMFAIPDFTTGEHHLKAQVTIDGKFRVLKSSKFMVYKKGASARLSSMYDFVQSARFNGEGVKLKVSPTFYDKLFVKVFDSHSGKLIDSGSVLVELGAFFPSTKIVPGLRTYVEVSIPGRFFNTLIYRDAVKTTFAADKQACKRCYSCLQNYCGQRKVDGVSKFSGRDLKLRCAKGAQCKECATKYCPGCAFITFAIASPTPTATISKRIVDWKFLENLVVQFLLGQEQRRELPGTSKYQIEKEMDLFRKVGIEIRQHDEILDYFDGHENKAIRAIPTLLASAWYSWSDLQERYETIEKIGAGSYSISYKVKLKTGQPETRALILSYFGKEQLELEYPTRISQAAVLLAVDRLKEVTDIFPTLNAFFLVSHSESVPLIASRGGKFSDSPWIAGYEMTYGDKGHLRQYREEHDFTYEQAFELCFGMWAARYFTGLFQTDISETNYVMRTSTYYRVYVIGSKEIVFPPGDIPTPIDFPSYRVFLSDTLIKESDAQCFEALQLNWKEGKRGGFYEDSFSRKVDHFYETLEVNIFKATPYLKSTKVPEGAPVKTYRLPEEVNEMIKEIQ